ncbi:Ku protein [Streptomyces sp. NPDC048629]|uniref:non-homologous end joining protein Ku n=1 Tax=Streptomyces sp. NPDC048629 TaxID=3154824 RepID=UPI003431FC47
MARPIWSGAVSFGLVSIPVALAPATESHDVSFKQIHLKDGGRIRYRKVCELDGKELSQDEIGKGYEVSKDRVIPITEEDLADMPLPTARAIEIVSSADADSIAPLHIGGGGCYLAMREQVAAKPYTLLREALKRTDRVAIAKFAFHGRERLGILRVRGDALLRDVLRWDDEIRDAAELAPEGTGPSEREMEGALALMDTMTVEHLADLGLADQYRDALVEVIEAKAEHRPPQSVAEAPEPDGHVVDLMSALEQSVQAARERRGDAGGKPGTVHEMPRKKTAAKKASAKKATAKKSAAKKTAPARRRKSA